MMNRTSIIAPVVKTSPPARAWSRSATCVASSMSSRTSSAPRRPASIASRASHTQPGSPWLPTTEVGRSVVMAGIVPAMSPAEPAHGAHLVGSVPLASAEVVFETVAAHLGDRVRRLPDGETGPRSDWIVWQLPVFTSQPQLEVIPPAPDSWRPLPRVRLTDAAEATRVRFEALGYADAALASYRVFARLKRDGHVPAAC